MCCDSRAARPEAVFVVKVKKADWRRVCASRDLLERGDGVRFELSSSRSPSPAFVLRIDGEPRAWLNRCAHISIELDWTAGSFFDSTRQWIVCATHGAHYEPVGGRCVVGPCKGRGLIRIPSREVDGWVEVLDSNGKDLR